MWYNRDAGKVMACPAAYLAVYRLQAMDSFASYTEFKRQDNAAYKLLNRVVASASYVGGDMRQGGWYIKNNPQFVTDAQWAKIATRMLAYGNLKGKTLPEVIESFYYEVRAIKIDDRTFYIPSGNIMGWMQGMFMCISADGNINT